MSEHDAYEYLTHGLPIPDRSLPEEQLTGTLHDVLNELGQQGWKLSHVLVNVGIFRRKLRGGSSKSD